jgi:hypothetical protein
MTGVLPLANREQDFDEALHALRSFLSAIAEQQVSARLVGNVPDVSPELAYLSERQDYDGCLTLLTLLRDYAEAFVNLQLLREREGRRTEYERMLAAGEAGTPEYVAGEP